MRGQLLILFFVFVYSKNTCSQELVTKDSYQRNYSEIFKRYYWNFFIRGGVGFQKGQIYKDANIAFSMKPAEVFQFGWMINFALPKRFAIQTGINLEIGYERFRYYIRENYYHNNIVLYNSNDDRYFHYRSLVIPLYFSYRIPVYNKKNNLFFEPKLGIDIKYMGAGFVVVDDIVQTINTTNSYPGIHLEQGTASSYAGGKKDIFSTSFVAGIGFNAILKNQGIINIQLIGTYNPFYKDKGFITFLPGTSQEKTIYYQFQYNSLGVEVNYLFRILTKQEKVERRMKKEQKRIVQEQTRF